MKRRIVITGTFCSLNKGDAAMRIALASELKKKMPDCEITITTPFADLDKGVYNGATIQACSRRRPGKVALLLLRALLWRIAHSSFRVDSLRLLGPELQTYRHSDLVIDTSGDGLTEEYGMRCLISHLVPIAIGKLLKRPVFVCAQTIGPFRKSRSLCRWLLRKAEAVTAREELTFGYLSDLGLKKTELTLVADMAFLMEPASPDRARQILADEGIRRDMPLLGISVSRLPGHLHGSGDSEAPARLELEMAEALDRFVAMGLRPVFISHVTGPGKLRDDRRAAMRIASFAKSSSEIDVLDGDYSPEETKAVIGEMDIFVGVRMHSNIAALSMGVPTISVAYGPKAFGIMGLAGQESWVLDIRDVTNRKLFDMVRKAWKSRSAIVKSLDREMPRVLRMAQRNVGIAQSLLMSKEERVNAEADAA